MPPAGAASDARFSKDEVRLGYISGVFGLRGEVRLFLYNRDSSLQDAPTSVELVSESGARREARVRCRSGAGKRVVGRFDGVDSIEAANRLVGHEIVISAAALPDLDESTFYHRELIGLPVEREDGTLVGKLAEIYTAGEVDTWVVRGDSGETFLAALVEVVLEVWPGEKIIVANDAGLEV